jgi:MFS family permease
LACGDLQCVAILWPLHWLGTNGPVCLIWPQDLVKVWADLIRFHARAVHLVACLYSIIVISAFWFTAQSYAAAVAFAALFGIGTGVMVSLPINDVADILGPNRSRFFGQYAGVVYLCASPFILAGPVITGVLEQEFGIWTVAAWACGGLAAGALLLGLGLCLRDDTEKFDEQALHESSSSSCV